MDFQQTSIKQNALGWVKKSIDDNLADVRSRLNIYIETKDPAILGYVDDQLSDIRGVLTMIEQYGASMLAEEMGALCRHIATRGPDDEAALEVLLRSVLQLPDYLEHIQAGHKDIPIAILPLLNDIRAARNEDLFSEKLLFLPDLSMHTEDIDSEAIEDKQNQISRAVAKKVRPTYQFALLGLIRDRDVVSNLERLTRISEALEERAATEQMARFWWIVGALIESIARDDLSLGVSTKMLLGKVDQELRRMMLHGERELLLQQPIDLIKNLLYYVAQPECNGPKSQAIKTAYRLEQFLPSDQGDGSSASIVGPNQELLKTVSDAIKVDLELVKSNLENYVTGDLAATDQLMSVPGELHVISDTLAMLGLGAQRQMIESQINMIVGITSGIEQPDQSRLLEMAAELIQVDHALELMQKGQLVQSEDKAASDSASQTFEMGNMLTAVVSAVLDDIQKIKEAILDFVKDSTRVENLQLSQSLLREAQGALALLNQEAAVKLVDGLVRYLESRDVVDFMESQRLDQLSQVVVSVEYFVEALGEQRQDAESILGFAESQLAQLLAGEYAPEAQADLESTHQNLLIDGGEDYEEIDEVALESVNLDNMEKDLADAEDEEPIITDDDEALEISDVTEVELPPEPDSDPFEAAPERAPTEMPPAAAREIPETVDFDTPATAHDSVDLVLDAAPMDDAPEMANEANTLATPVAESMEPGEARAESAEADEDAAAETGAEAEAEAEAGVESANVPLKEVVSDLNDGLEAIQDVLSISALSDQAVQPADVERQSSTGQPALEQDHENHDVAQGLSTQPVETDEPVERALPAAPEIDQDDSPAAQARTDQVDSPGEMDDGIVAVEEDQPVIQPGADPEILEIYLEEADEESASIQQLQQEWAQHPLDETVLQSIRRSFHTIKGSGRLVGAMKIGEFAWDFENLLNRVIDKSIETNEQVINAVGLAANALPELVDELKGGPPPQADTAYLRGLARALSGFDSNQVTATNRQAPEEGVAKVSSAGDNDSDDGGEEPEPTDTDTAPLIGGVLPQPATQHERTEQATDERAPETLLEPLPVDQSDVYTPPSGVDESTDDMALEARAPHDPFVLSDMADTTAAEAQEAPPVDPATDHPPLQIDPELLVIYQQEVESHLSTVDSVLSQAENEHGLTPTEDLYRALHTINGASKTARISSIGALASLLEKPLKVLIEESEGLDADGLELYREGRDQIRDMTRQLVEQRRMPELPGRLVQNLEALIEGLDHHTIELPEQNDQASSGFVDTLTMMNESPDSDYDDELVEIFIEEANDLLEMCDHTLQTWKEQDELDDTPGYGLVMELQRYLHTLKGGAKMADFVEISDLSHELESIFIAVIDSRLEKSDDLIDILHDSFDLLHRQVSQASEHQTPQDSSEQVAALRDLRGVKTGHGIQAVATQQKVDESVAHDDAPGGEAEDSSAEVGPLAESGAQAEPSPVDDAGRRDRDVVKVRSDLLDNLVNSAGEVSIYRARMEQQVSSFGSHLGELGQTIARLKRQLRDLEAETDAQIHFSHRQDIPPGKEFDPLEMDRYTQIQQLSKALGESVDDLSSLQNILGDQVKDSETLLLQQSRINTDLQDGLIRSRMVRFSGLVSRLRRLVRQTSSELAKKAELRLSGESNEVDIKVLDRMVAPVEHIIRNAIAHGIESPMDRVAKGKSETGVISIDISRDGSDIVLRIADDGAGVDVDKVRSRALQLGLLGEREIMDDNEVIQFILEPGFSTAEQVSQVSGRGVGMDVVDTGIKQLGGALQISTGSQGTVFTARLPFTLSINQAILVRAGEEVYALPLINIEGITRIEADQMMDNYQQDRPVLEYAGQHYGLHYLSALVGVSTSYLFGDAQSKVPVILLRSGDLRVALHIDEIIGNREIVVKPLGKQLSQVKGLSGASIMADGSVVLILDVNGLIRHGVNPQVIAIAEEQPDEHADEHKPRKMVMVVDDSITMRRVASKLLTRHDYQVVTAKDGVDALAQLEENNPDVMLLDIEMPRMDGFELANHMRNEPRFSAIPIIMITSRTGTKHRDHALELGVDRYMGKPYQESELIDSIASLVG